MTAPRAFSVLGAGGTIGRALTLWLRERHEGVSAIDRAALPDFLGSRRSVGHVIDCVGLTGDFRTRPIATAEAHVGLTARCLAALACDSFLFLSSTRVYAGAAATQEGSALTCQPADPSDLYNLTKLTGEALCLHDPRETVRVVRLSNVVAAEPGPDTFLGQVLQEGRSTGRVLFRQGEGSAKDYIGLDDVCRLLPAIAVWGQHRIYNVASGSNVTHRQIADLLHDRFGWQTRFADGAADVVFPPIDTTRLNAEFGIPLSNLSEQLARLSSGQEAPCSRSTRRPVA